jgi:hypothetical protein
MNDPDRFEANHRAKLSAVIAARDRRPAHASARGRRRTVRSRPEGSEKVAMILSDKLPELFVLDRYERRALSKRSRNTRSMKRASSGCRWTNNLKLYFIKIRCVRLLAFLFWQNEAKFLVNSMGAQRQDRRRAAC